MRLVQFGTPEGRWSPAAALEHIRQLPKMADQVENLTALVQGGVELPWHRALELCQRMPDKEQSKALGVLGPVLPKNVIPLAFEAARAINTENYRADALSSLAGH